MTTMQLVRRMLFLLIGGCVAGCSGLAYAQSGHAKAHDAKAAGAAATMPAEYQKAMDYLGKKGDYQDHVLKLNVPRTDLAMTVGGIKLPTPFGFGGWVAMTPGAGGHQVLMGDLVLLPEEVNPVLSALLDHGLEVTALHNHFFYEHPRLAYMHVHGHGTAMELAERVKPALDLIGHVVPLPAAGEGRALPSTPALDTAALTRIVGHAGEQFGPVYKIIIGRSDLHVREMGALINARMGLNTWAAFAGSNDEAAIAGDIAMLSSEVQPVLKALRSHGLEVVSIHNHMIGTAPAIYFLHYWGTGPAEKLAAGFKAAVAELGRKR